MSPCVGDDWDLNDNEIAVITSTVFAGILLGSLFWGPFADYYGRRLAFLWGKTIIFSMHSYYNYFVLYLN